MLAASLLPDIVANEILQIAVPGLIWGKVVLLLLVVGMSFVWDVLRSVRYFAAFLMLLLLLETGRGYIVQSAFWQGWFGGANPSFINVMLRDQVLRVGVALLMIVVLVIVYGRRQRIYVTKGDLRADVKPIPWLGIKAHEITWARFGWMSALAIGAGTALFLFANGTLDGDAFPQLIQLMPFILLFAAMNAFAEEVSYRAALLAPLKGIIPQQHAIMLTALFFGFAHYYGVPYGVLGVVMATVLGWLLSKSMIETQGLFWPWFIHFVQDVLIFSFMALGFVVPGG
jgi:membrane protease YdiL (CAAX protease family)